MAKSTSNRRVMTKALLCALVLVMTVGVTLAYLSTVTTAEANAFTFVSGADISVRLSEGGWVSTNAQNLSASDTVTKEPQLTNNSSNEEIDEYVALQITFTYGDGTEMSTADFETLSGLITINWNTDTAWVTSDGTDVGELTTIGSAVSTTYYYDAILTNSSTTEALFNSVTINASASTSDMTWLANLAGGGFNILVQGAATQTTGFVGNITGGTGAEGEVLAYTELDRLFSEGV